MGFVDTNLNFRLTSNLDEIISRISAMTEYLERAPDGDPIKTKIAAFGEIDMDKHLSIGVDYQDGEVVIEVTPCPELRIIMDAVPK